MCGQVLAKKPDFFDAQHLLAIVQAQSGRNDDALANYDRALTLRPGHAEVLNNRAVALQELHRLDEAVAGFDQAIAASPEYREALYNRANALKELKRYDEALTGYDQALARQPDSADAFNNRGFVLHQLARYEDALASYERALAIQPNHFDAIINYGVSLKELQRFDEALAAFDRARTVRRDPAEAHLAEAEIRLLTGDFAAGWTKYEWRQRIAPHENFSPDHDFQHALWLGSEALDGKTILLQCEQGFGNTLQFCRYVPMVAKRGARVVLQVQKPLQELMARLDGTPRIIAEGDPLPNFHFYCPLLSLPLAFQTQLESIPAHVPYLSASKAHLKKWAKRLPKPAGPRIGLSWAGDPNFKSDPNRSIGLQPLLPLLARTDMHFFSLQKELRAGDEEILRSNPLITHIGDEIETFEDTAAIISQFDLIISCDTALVHLAGALGKPVWILLSFTPDWRWLLDRDDSPWYPTARLFRQTETRDWESAIKRVQGALREFTKK